jgi:hypothetical protein
MQYIPLPHGLKIEIMQSKDNVQIVNRIFAVKVGYWSIVDQEYLAIGAKDVWLDELASQISNTIRLNAVRVTDLTQQDGPVVTKSFTNLAGGKTEQPLPISDALVVTLRTPARGRSARGRMYISGWTEDQWDGSLFSTNVANTALNYCNELDNMLRTYGFSWVIASFRSNGRWREEAYPYYVSSFEVRSRKPGSQRRRDARP